ncbi:unnamed protein product, partial [Polarella glacialis]
MKLLVIHAGSALLIAIYLVRPRGYTGADPFVLDVGQPPADPADDTCTSLNQLESRAMDINAGGKETAEYQTALEAWRRQHPGYQPACRTRGLGAQMCRDGARLAKLMGPPTGDEWDLWMRELAAHETTAEDCLNFADWFVPKKWLPHVFHWPQETQEVILDELINDPEYGSAYAAAMHLAPPFGAPQIAFRQRPQGRFQMHRVEQLNHWRVLRKAVPGLEVSSLQQIVEFGGGNGNLPAMFFDLGYTGAHYVYDFPTMLLMQRYWLHYSGVPAVLGTDVPRVPQTTCSKNWMKSTQMCKMKIILENALGEDLNSHLDPAKLRDSLFIATYSFTEADMASRAKIWRTVKEFGVIQLAFWGEFYGKDNLAHLQDLVDTDLRKTHRVVWWEMPPGWHATSGKAYYLVAVRKDRGTVLCVEEAGCSKGTARL